MIGTLNGIFKTTDYRRSPGGRWNKDLVLGAAATFEDASAQHPFQKFSVIEASESGPGIAPEVAGAF